MSQISPPIRILLVAVIGLCAAYMLFLRPKEEAVPAATARSRHDAGPGQGPERPDSSKPGARRPEGRPRRRQRLRARRRRRRRRDHRDRGRRRPRLQHGVNTNPVAGAPATGQTSAPAAPVTKEALKRLPKDVRGAVKNRKVIVMLFYNNRSYDDRAVRRELSKVDRFGGQVFVDAHWIKSVGRYQAITGGVDVDQSPTVVVADRNLKARDARRLRRPRDDRPAGRGRAPRLRRQPDQESLLPPARRGLRLAPSSRSRRCRSRPPPPPSPPTWPACTPSASDARRQGRARSRRRRSTRGSTSDFNQLQRRRAPAHRRATP